MLHLQWEGKFLKYTNRVFSIEKFEFKLLSNRMAYLITDSGWNIMSKKNRNRIIMKWPKYWNTKLINTFLEFTFWVSRYSLKDNWLVRIFLVPVFIFSFSYLNTSFKQVFLMYSHMKNQNLLALLEISVLSDAVMSFSFLIISCSLLLEIALRSATRKPVK